MLRKTAMSVAAIAAIVCSVTIAGANFAPKASAEQTSSSDIPFNTGALNPCNGQLVSIAGVEHSMINVTQTPGGNLTISQHTNYSDVKGTDPLGNTYVVHDSDNPTMHFSGQGGEVLTFPQSFALVTRGSAPNFEVHVLFHVTITPNGDVSAFVDNFTSTCSP